MHSLLKWPGAKSLAKSIIRSHFPFDYRSLCSPFLGGGSIEVDCAIDGCEIYANDIDPDLMNFWRHAIADSRAVADRTARYCIRDRESFFAIRDSYPSIKSDLDRAAAYWMINRSAYMGRWSGYCGAPMTCALVDRLRRSRLDRYRINVSCGDAIDAIQTCADRVDLIYCDPPYVDSIRYRYHDDSIHARLAAALHAVRDRVRWAVSYRQHPAIAELYPQSRVIDLPEWRYRLRDSRADHVYRREFAEVLIKNY